jgi:hypothetical protein
MVEKKYIVVTGVPSIKKYVFGTDQLKEIRGASALLEDLTRNRIIEYLNKCRTTENLSRLFFEIGQRPYHRNCRIPE